MVFSLIIHHIFSIWGWKEIIYSNLNVITAYKQARLGNNRTVTLWFVKSGEPVSNLNFLLNTKEGGFSLWNFYCVLFFSYIFKMALF